MFFSKKDKNSFSPLSRNNQLAFGVHGTIYPQFLAFLLRIHPCFLDYTYQCYLILESMWESGNCQAYATAGWQANIVHLLYTDEI
jgi:hypothetical protein